MKCLRAHDKAGLKKDAGTLRRSVKTFKKKKGKFRSFVKITFPKELLTNLCYESSGTN